METWLIQLANGQWLRIDATNQGEALRRADDLGYSGTLRGQISNPQGDFFAENQYQQAYLSASQNPSSIVRIRNNDEVVDGAGNVLRPSPTPSFGDPVTGPVTPIVGSEEIEFGPAFRAGLRTRGITAGRGGGVQGEIARQAQDPLFSRFLTGEAFSPLAPGTTGVEDPGEDPVSFQRFIQTTPNLFGQSGAASARNILNRAIQLSSGGSFDPQSLEAANATAGAAGLLNPADIKSGLDLARVAREAGRQRFGSLNRFLAPTAMELSSSFFEQPQAGALSFADFLNQRIFGR